MVLGAQDRRIKNELVEPKESRTGIGSGLKLPRATNHDLTLVALADEGEEQRTDGSGRPQK